MDHRAAQAQDAASSPDDVVDTTFRTAVRHDLGGGAWLDVVPGWIRRDRSLFDELYDEAPWELRRRVVDGVEADEPRLTAWWAAPPTQPDVPIAIAGIASALSQRYGIEFSYLVAMLYRDGDDHVDLHSDGFPDILPRPLVAIASLGEPRELELREKASDDRRRVLLGSGDLVVMGGEIQQLWEHGVPVATTNAPRISLQLRAVGPPT